MEQSTAKQILVDEFNRLELEIKSNQSITTKCRKEAQEFIDNMKAILASDDWYDQLTNGDHYSKLTQQSIAVENKTPGFWDKVFERLKILGPIAPALKSLIELIMSFWR